MVFLLMAQGLVSLVKASVRPLAALHAYTDEIAGVKKGSPLRPVTFTFLFNEEELAGFTEDLLQNPAAVRGWSRAKVMQADGTLPPCPACGR